MSFQSSCPTCGAPIEFGVATSLVAVCDSCDSVVGRADGKLESYGKVADLVQTDSPLQIGVEGKVKGTPFEITGRTQLRHAGGGVWDEWYLSFHGGEKWGWLSESQGRYHVTFPKRMPQEATLPPPAELSPGQSVTIPGVGILTVNEVGDASVIAAEGEIPMVFRPGESYPYADLSGGGHKFATIDGSESPPLVFTGAEVTLKQLGIDETVLDRDKEERFTAAASVSCPQCGGTLELAMPDQSERVGCPFCDSLLDVNEGNLQFLKKLKEGPKPVIPLGSKGTLDGIEFQVIGFMQRMVKYEGKRYYWTEYLLYAPRTPFHWLVHSNNHWTLGKGVPAGSVQFSARSASHDGKTFRLFDRSHPEVTYVVGEFYWSVNVGDVARAADFVKPPRMLSCEYEHFNADTGEAVESKEVNWTLARYLPVEEVTKAFGVKVPAPVGVGPCEPFKHKGVYLLWLMTIAGAILLYFLFGMAKSSKPALTETVQFEKTTADSPVSHTTKSFALKSRRNNRVTVSTSTANAWAYLDATLYNEKTGKTHPFTVAVKHRQGGSGRGRTKFISAVPGGTYVLKLKAQWQNMKMGPVRMTVSIRQGVTRFRYFMLLLLGLSAMPLMVAMTQGVHESRRWSESDYSPFG